MRTSRRNHLPLQPLLHAFLQLPPVDPNPRTLVIRSARSDFLSTLYLASTPDERLLPHLDRFYSACVQPALHREVLQKRIGFVRHGLVHLLNGTDSLPARFANCVAPRGAYAIAGLGPLFWSSMAQGLRPDHHPLWTPKTIAGLRRLGLDHWERDAGPGPIYAAMLAAYAQVQALAPGLSASRIDRFLELVAGMDGRRMEDAAPDDPIGTALLRLRQAEPLRDRLTQRGRQLSDAQHRLQESLASRDGKALGLALGAADPESVGRSPLDWGQQGDVLAEWISRFWNAESPEPLLRAFWCGDPLPGAGLWLPAAVLHLRDPQRFVPYNDAVRRGLAVLDDCTAWTPEPADAYRLACETSVWLRQHHGLHPLEVPALLAVLAGEPAERPSKQSHPSALRFGGFCADTFLFLEELGRTNRRTWMDSQRPRYRFAVRQPMIELCLALAQRYVEPVLAGVHGWKLDTTARTGRALTSICRNNYGQGDPYATALWIAFCRSGRPAARADAQFFVRLDAVGLRYGVRIGRKALAAAGCFHYNVQRHADALWQALERNGATADCLVGQAEDGGRYALAGPAALWEWAKGRSFEIARSRPADDPLLSGDDLVGDILLTFDRLLPAFACAVEADPAPFLADRRTAAGPRYSAGDFEQDTGLDASWLDHIRHLLDLKSQLILQGVPGTGKTHVVRCLARFLTSGRDDAIRLVQFHPAYSYEEFVEGVKVRSVDVDGRPEATYPVEDGVLLAFAAEAARHPAQPHVLIIDEINRGNLPRLFGELLYLLEYRQQSVQLPCSRRDFQLPANLFLLATMNAADRSVVRLDQALRRRFSLVTMNPDARILSSWLMRHDPADGPLFTRRVLTLFERLNARLLRDLGPQAQVGHSYFMAPDLTEERLQMIWRHHVQPLLAEHLTGRPELLADYELEALLEESPRRRRPAPSLRG